MNSKKNVLFLCTGNSCRSQMGEAMVNHYLAGSWQGFSAGTRPTGYVHPKALLVLQEQGIDVDGLVSKSAETLSDITFERVYTVCDNAATDCPTWFGPGTVAHIPFYDPADATGSEEEVLFVFRQVRDQIYQQIIRQISSS